MMNHEALMRHAMHMADTARMRARPNPWVGAVVVCASGAGFEGATQAPGQAHAEIEAMNAARAAGESLAGATLYTTLEPCSHTGRTGPCAQAIIDAGISHVVAAIADPDEKVSGNGFAMLRHAGVHVTAGICAVDVTQQLAAYLHHRRTGRPFVMLKMATTLDARTAIPHGPRWITGEEARIRVHQLRAESDAIVVGAGTVRTDNPELTVRHVDGPSPRRIVLTSTPLPADVAVHPCTEWSGDMEDLLHELGRNDVIQLMVEGGPRVATSFHKRGLIDRYVFHVAPVIAGSNDAPGVFMENTATTLSECTLVSAGAFGADLETVLDPIREKEVTP